MLIPKSGSIHSLRSMPSWRRRFSTFTSDEVDWILETFPIVKERDIARYGDYRTKLLVLEHYDSISTTPGSSNS